MYIERQTNGKITQWESNDKIHIKLWRTNEHKSAGVRFFTHKWVNECISCKSYHIENIHNFVPPLWNKQKEEDKKNRTHKVIFMMTMVILWTGKKTMVETYLLSGNSKYRLNDHQFDFCCFGKLSGTYSILIGFFLNHLSSWGIFW